MLQFNKGNWDELNKECIEISKQIKRRYDAGDDVNTLWELFKTLLNQAIDTHIPSKQIRSNSNLPWMNVHLKRLVRKKTRLHRQAKKSRNWTVFNNFQKTCRDEFRKAEWDYVNKTISEGLENKNSKPLWSYIKSKKNDNLGVSPLKENGKIFSESKDKAEILLRQFSSVFTKTVSLIMPPVSLFIHEPLEQIQVETKGVEKLLHKIQPHKAKGPDNIPNYVLKNCSSTLAPGIALIFQKSLDSSTLPKDWTDANVSPIYKKGDRQSAENYRPVSLTSVLSKTLEHIVCHTMHKHFEKHNVLTNLNHGFRKGFSCETQLTITVEI